MPLIRSKVAHTLGRMAAGEKRPLWRQPYWKQNDQVHLTHRLSAQTGHYEWLVTRPFPPDCLNAIVTIKERFLAQIWCLEIIRLCVPLYVRPRKIKGRGTFKR